LYHNEDPWNLWFWTIDTKNHKGSSFTRFRYGNQVFILALLTSYNTIVVKDIVLHWCKGLLVWLSFLLRSCIPRFLWSLKAQSLKHLTWGFKRLNWSNINLKIFSLHLFTFNWQMLGLGFKTLIFVGHFSWNWVWFTIRRIKHMHIQITLVSIYLHLIILELSSFTKKMYVFHVDF